MKKFTLLCLSLLAAMTGVQINAQEKTNFPINLTSADGLPGTDNGNNYVYTSPVYELDSLINGIRVTFLEVQGDAITFNGFPVVALAELKIFDGNGESIEYTVNNISTNSCATNDGALKYICDGNADTYYHSTWSNGNGITPDEFVYIDVEFPTPLTSFQYSQVCRNNDALMPSKIQIDAIEKKADIYASGNIGDSITWKINISSGEMRIAGNGKLRDYSSSNQPWYNYRSYIREVVFGDSITAVGNNAFYYYFDNLRKVSFSNSITSIGEYAFHGCDNLSDVSLGGNLVTIGNEAFYNCNIQEITLPNCLKNIGDYAFYNNEFKNIIIPDSVTSIGRYAFSYCYALEQITLGNNVTSIGEYAFYDCNNLKLFESKATAAPSIADNAFYSTDNLSIIYVPEGSGEAYRNAGIWNNYVIVAGEGVTLDITLTEAGTLGEQILAQVEYLSDVNNLKVSGSINDDDLYNIKNRMTSLVNLDLSGVERESLQNNLFSDKRTLRTVVLPSGLRWIADEMFRNCTMLEDLILPGTLESIGGDAFYNCDNLRNISIPEGVTEMLDDAFYDCDALEEVSLPSTLSSINGYTFYGCNKLKNVSFTEGLKTISYRAFDNCTSLDNVKLPSTLETIGVFAFQQCTSLKNISLNEGLTTISDRAFYSCTSLKEIVLPSTVTSIDNAFCYCNNLKKVTCLSLLPPYLYNNYNNNSPFGSTSMEGRTLYAPALTLNKYKLVIGWDNFPVIEGINVMPENIYIYDAQSLTWPDGLAVAYKPNVTLGTTYKEPGYYSYGSLQVEGNATVSVGNFNMAYDPEYYYHYSNYSTCYSALVNEAAVRADSISIILDIMTNSWYFLSFPFDVKVADIAPAYDNTNFVIRKYSGEARANGDFSNTWQNMTIDSVLHAGKGYIWQCNRYDNNGSYQSMCRFVVSAMNNTNKNNIFANDDVNITLDEYLSEFGHNRSWNLAGNPYPCFYDTRFMNFTAPITVWSESNSTYTAYSPMDDEFILRPGEAFFVQRPVDTDGILFTATGRQVDMKVRSLASQAPAQSRSISAMREIFNITLSNGENNDKTRFVINDNALTTYETTCDASKFMSSDANVSQLYTIEDGVAYAINERPMNDGIIKLGTYFSTNGKYTISLDSECNTKVVLTDKQNGEETTLNNNTYEFTAEAGTFENRFEIKLINGYTAINETTASPVKISTSGCEIAVSSTTVENIAIYTADGRLVKETNAANTSATVIPGIYIIKIAGQSYKVAVTR